MPAEKVNDQHRVVAIVRVMEMMRKAPIQAAVLVVGAASVVGFVSEQCAIPNYARMADQAGPGMARVHFD